MSHKCPTCGADNPIVNACRCDPNNLPTVPYPGPALQEIINAAAEATEHFTEDELEAFAQQLRTRTEP